MDLAHIAMIGMVLGPILMILSWPLAEIMTEWEIKREKKKKEAAAAGKPVKKQEKKSDPTFGNPYLKKFYEALDRGDEDGMRAALEECKAHCSGANSWCLTEMFCPECPMAGMPVQSARYGM